MALFQNGGGLRRVISKEETKNCPLCGALNYHLNQECIGCSWHGVFEKNQAVMDFHWQMLLDRYEEVRLEHVTPKRTREVSEFGIVRKRTLGQNLHAFWALFRQRLAVEGPANVARGAASPRK